MSAWAQRGRLWILTAAAIVVGGLFSCAMLPGCGSVAQRTVSAMAVAAVAADEANSDAYELISLQAVKDARDAGTGFPGWCVIMRAPWERCSRAECAIEALADLAIAGQAAVDAGDELGPQWLSAACGVLKALEHAWAAGEDPPDVVTQARALVCGLTDDPGDPPTCSDPGPPPPCEEVQ